MDDYDLSTVELFLNKPDQLYGMILNSERFVAHDIGVVKIFHARIGMYLFYLKDDKPVGMSHLSPVKDKGLTIMKVEYSVLPDHRLEGIATQLIRLGIEYMGQWGIQMNKPFDMVEADIVPGNRASIKIIESLGLNITRTYTLEGTSYLVYADMLEYE